MALDRDLNAADMRRTTQARRRRDGSGRSSPELPALAAAAIAGGALALSAFIGRRYSPTPEHPGIDRWYHRLHKPPFTPPDPVFGIVWPVLEIGLAIGGYRLMRAPSGRERDIALALWAINVTMIAGWTKVFFGERSPAGGAALAAAQLAAGIAYVERTSRVDPTAAATGIPYAVWVAFANVVAEEVWRRNQGGAEA